MKGRHTYWLEKLIQREIAKKILDLETQSKFMEVSMAKPITDDGAWDISWPQPANVEVHVASTSISEIEKSFVLDTLESNWIGPGGSYNNLVENFLSETLRQDTILVANGTIAIVLALQALGVGPGDEVIVPDLTYAATASAVVMVGATPIFADVNLDSWCIEVNDIEKLITNKTKAVIVVHLYGNMGEVKLLSAFCKMRSLYLIEDCAEWGILRSAEILKCLSLHKSTLLLAVHPGFYRPYEPKMKGLDNILRAIWYMRNFSESLRVFTLVNKFGIIQRTNLDRVRNKNQFAALKLGGYYEFIVGFN